MASPDIRGAAGRPPVFTEHGAYQRDFIVFGTREAKGDPGVRALLPVRVRPTRVRAPRPVAAACGPEPPSAVRDRRRPIRRGMPPSRDGGVDRVTRRCSHGQPLPSQRYLPAALARIAALR